jgi:CheY-like chemotaxis protein
MKTSYNLKLYSSPKEAMEQLKDSPNEADLILLDIMMPELDGISFLKEIKSNNSLKEIPVIMQSGVADMNQIDESLNIGAADFIRKPFSKEVLIKAIENIFK